MPMHDQGGTKMKTRWRRGLALLLTLFLLSGNLAFAEALPGTGEEPVIQEETVAENEEAPVENAENTGLEAEDQLETSEENVPEPVRGAGDTIYLDGKNGDNTKDGSTPENAVKTFGQAKTLATNNQGVTRIVVIGTTEIKGDITLKGTKAKILRGENFNDYVFKVPAGEIATLNNITIDGNNENNKTITQSLIHAESDSTLNIQENTVIRNNEIMAIENTATNGGGIRADNATLNMSGGVVEGNQATYGGGICLYGSTMNFTGGSVQSNRSEQVIDNDYGGQVYSAGGGICVTQGSTIHMSSDAIVSKNFACEIGGGISLGHNQWGPGNTLYMSGGKIDGNIAGASGGGLFIQAKYFQGGISKAYISAGDITNNRMSGEGKTDMLFGGGGIYVNGAVREYKGTIYNGENGELYLTNAVIRDNVAQGTKTETVTNPSTNESVTVTYPAWGGGFAACPISKTEIRVTNGVAIYGNRRKKSEKDAGKDFFVISLPPEKIGFHAGNPAYKLSKRMLGGAAWQWIDEDAGNTPLADNKYQGTLAYEERIALYTDFPAQRGAQEEAWINTLAKVRITGNTSATAGGGIGSNGSVFFGTEGDTTKVEVEKKWDNDDDEKRPRRIQVQLLAKLEGGDKTYVVETRTVTATDEWKVTFDNLPEVYHPDFKVENGSFVPSDIGKKIIYSVKEVRVPGYKSEVTGNAKDGFVITNKRKPEKPPTPSEKTIEIPVEKIWQDEGHEDKRPTEITVALYADGVATDKTLVLSAANEWKGVFRNLPEKKDGKMITYTVQEVEVKGYESVLTGNQSDGFVLTNTYKPEKPPTPPTPPTPPIPPIPFVRIPRAGA